MAISLSSGGSLGNNPFYQQGTNQNSFTDDYSNRATEGLLTGGLSGFKDLSHDWKRAFGKKQSGPTYSDQVFAELTRQQWADYQRDIVPYENKLIEFATSTTAANENMARAQERVAGAFQRQEAATSDALRSRGLVLDADEQRVATRLTDLSKSLASVNAANRAGMQTRAMQASLLGNPTPNVQDLS